MLVYVLQIYTPFNMSTLCTYIHKKEGGWYYVVSANKASSMTL